MVLVCALVAFHLQACAYRPPPKESMHAVQLGLGHERRSLWGLACKVVRTRPCIERSVRETGHLGTRARDEGTAILFWGRHLSVRAIVANGRAIVPVPLSLSFCVSLNGCLRWGCWLV